MTPKTAATPPAAKTAAANGWSAAASASVTLNIAGSAVSSENFIASGLGVVEAVAVATSKTLRLSAGGLGWALIDVGTPRQ